FRDEICVQYRSKDNVIKGTKNVKVEYVWKPFICSQCKVFGHRDERCMKFKGTAVDNARENGMNKENMEVKDVDGFTEKEKEVVSNDEENIKEKRSDKGKSWTIKDAVDKALRSSQNKFAPLETMSEKQELNFLKDRIIVD
nr:hypothetical protein [Tanacetum cinerariifolium]